MQLPSTTKSIGMMRPSVLSAPKSKDAVMVLEAVLYEYVSAGSSTKLAPSPLIMEKVIWPPALAVLRTTKIKESVLVATCRWTMSIAVPSNGGVNPWNEEPS